MTFLLFLFIMIADHPTGPVVSYREYREEAGLAPQLVAQTFYAEGKPVERSEYVYVPGPTPRPTMTLHRRILYGPEGYSRNIYLRSMTERPFLTDEDVEPLTLSDGTAMGYRICRNAWDGYLGETLGWSLTGRYADTEITHELAADWSVKQTTRRTLDERGRVVFEQAYLSDGTAMPELKFIYVNDERGNWVDKRAIGANGLMVYKLLRHITYEAE